jgi:hypothetical protein
LSRIGARELLYGPVDRVIPPIEIGRWITKILENEWNNPRPVGAALVQMARKTGDRMRDLDQEILIRAIQWLQAMNMADEADFLTAVKPMATMEESKIFGESLPTGILLHEA